VSVEKLRENEYATFSNFEKNLVKKPFKTQLTNSGKTEKV